MTRSKILFISDLHYNNRIFRGHDESVALDWIIDIIKTEKPDLILSAGDWDNGFQTPDDFLKITSLAPLFTIYGNHENMQALEKAVNPLLGNRKILIDDCELIQYKDVTFTGINGIISKKRRKHGVKRKTLHEFMDIASKCPSANFFITHEVPAISPLTDVIKLSPYTKYVVEIFRKVDSDLVLGGHIHANCFTFYRNGEFTYLRVDSSQAHRCYATIEPETRTIEIKQDKALIDTFVF